MNVTISTPTKILSVVCLFLLFLVYTLNQQLQIRNESIKTLTAVNGQLSQQVANLTVNIEHAADVNTNLNSLIDRQNVNIAIMTGTVNELKKKVDEHKETIIKIQKNGTTFSIPNNSKTAEEHIQHMRKSAPLLMNFDPRKSTEQNGSSS